MADLKFKIDGQEYDPPDLSTYDMDEAVVLYEYTGFAMEDLFFDEDDPDPEVLQRLRHPGIIKTMLHISYQRANPDVKPAKVKELIGKASYADAVNVLYAIGVAEDDARPPDQQPGTSEPPKPSDENSNLNGSSSLEKHASSGNASTVSSDVPAGDPPTIATLGSPAPSLVTHARMPAA